MTIAALPMEFSGHCCGCDSTKEDRPAVEVFIDRDPNDDIGDWICLACARRLCRRVARAVEECEKKVAAGYVYRNDRWQKSKGDAF